jgi:hypothetical protein
MLMVINRLLKKSVFIPCYKTTTVKEIAFLFIYYIWRYFGPSDSIISNCKPQFISDF